MDQNGGYLVERWVQGCAAQMGAFSASQVYQWLIFYLKIGLDIGRIFAKCLIVDDFFLWFTYRLSKSTYASQLTFGKNTAWFKKKGPSRNKWFRHRLQIFVLSGLVKGGG